MSYWNRPFFPEGCADATLHDPVSYDTMVRIAGSFGGFARAFKVVADMHGWSHIVLVADDDTSQLCWYIAKPFDELLSKHVNYTFTWLRLGSDPTDDQLDDILEQIRSHARGSRFFVHLEPPADPRNMFRRGHSPSVEWGGVSRRGSYPSPPVRGSGGAL